MTCLISDQMMKGAAEAGFDDSLPAICISAVVSLTWTQTSASGPVSLKVDQFSRRAGPPAGVSVCVGL